MTESTAVRKVDYADEDWSRPPIKPTECADWYHAWNIYGICQRCGKRLEET